MILSQTEIRDTRYAENLQPYKLRKHHTGVERIKDFGFFNTNRTKADPREASLFYCDRYDFSNNKARKRLKKLIAKPTIKLKFQRVNNRRMYRGIQNCPATQPSCHLRLNVIVQSAKFISLSSALHD